MFKQNIKLLTDFFIAPEISTMGWLFCRLHGRTGVLSIVYLLKARDRTWEPRGLYYNLWRSMVRMTIPEVSVVHRYETGGPVKLLPGSVPQPCLADLPKHILQVSWSGILPNRQDPHLDNRKEPLGLQDLPSTRIWPGVYIRKQSTRRRVR